MSKKKELFFLCIILAIGIFFRFYKISSTPPGLYSDEAMNGINALQAIDSQHFKPFYSENNGREGLFINLQALAILIFGTQAWALRAVAAIFGSLTILGVYLLTKELFFYEKYKGQIALLTAFFITISYWHINFSRLGFRAITTPFFVCFTLFFLIICLRKQKWFYAFFAGLAMGLGLSGYIAFRLVPFIVVVPIFYYLIISKQRKKQFFNIVILVVTTLITVLPLINYFWENPAEFAQRPAQISIFIKPNHFELFVENTEKTIQMLFSNGDNNWRHNISLQPALSLLTFISAYFGLFFLFYHCKKNKYNYFILTLLLLWIIFLSLPTILTLDNTPNSLRAIGIIPPIMILAGYGFFNIYYYLTTRFKRAQQAFFVLCIIIFCLNLYSVFDKYFNYWAFSPYTYAAFFADQKELAGYLNKLPKNVEKNIIINNSAGIEQVNNIPIYAQPLLFLTDTTSIKKQQENNFKYYAINNMPVIEVNNNIPIVIAIVNKSSEEIENFIKKYPQMKIKEIGSFTILNNF